jgi:hypothetical protein
VAWRRDITTEITNSGKYWREIEQLARNRRGELFLNSFYGVKRP